MKAVIFTRVSSSSQEEGVSLDAQEAKLRDYCEDKGLEVLETFRVVESSTKGHRKQFHKALAFIEKQKEKTALVVHSIDRLLRGFKEYGLIEALIESDQLEIHTYNERLVINRNTSWMEQLQFDFSVLGAKMYVGQIRQHVQKAIDYKLQQGEAIGHVPTGYLNYRDPVTRKSTVVLDQERAFLVKRIFQEYGTGIYSVAEVLKMATNWGLKSPRTGKPLVKASLCNILKNPFYFGEMKVKGQLYTHQYPTLVDRALFDKCQEVLEASSTNRNSITTRREQRAKKAYIFRGLIRCQSCGCQIFSDTKKGRYTYLACSKAKGKELCQAKRIREEKALAVIESVLSRISIPSPMIRAIHDRLKKQYENERSAIKARTQQLQKHLNAKDEQLDKLLDLFLKGSITQDTYDKKRQSLESEKKQFVSHLQATCDNDSEFRESFVTLLQVVSQACEIFRSSKVEQKRKIIRLVFSNLYLEGENVRYELNKPFDKLLDLAECQEWWALLDSNQ